MGFPADARDVYMHSSVLSNVRPAEAPITAATQEFGFGANSNYTTVAAKSFIGRQDTAAAPWEYTGGSFGCCEHLSRTGLEASADAADPTTSARDDRVHPVLGRRYERG